MPRHEAEDNNEMPEPLTRQPMNPDLIRQITDELMAPVAPYRHARAKPVDPPTTEIPKRPRRVKAVKTP